MKPQNQNVENAQKVALDAKVEEIKQLLSEDASNELARRHRIGLAVLDLKDGRTYGDRAVERLAKRIGYDKSTLYEYADVAKTWPSEALEKLCARRTTKGMPITFSHLVELAAVASERRVTLLERVFEKSLSVRALQELIGDQDNHVGKPKKAISGRAAKVGMQTTDRSGLAGWIAEVDAQLEAQARWTSSLPEIRTLPSTAELAQQLTTAIASNEALRAAAAETTKLLEIERQRVATALTDTPRSSSPTRLDEHVTTQEAARP